MRRRDLIVGLCARVAWPLPAGAQPKTIPVVGMLRPTPRAADLMEKALRGNMAALGWQDGRTVAYQFVFTEGDSSRLQELAAELVGTRPAVLVGSGYSSLRALQDRTRTIPIVGILADDFVGQGLASSMARPGGNVTGVSILGTQLEAKRLELLREAVPSAQRIGVILDPAIPVSRERWQVINEMAQALGAHLQVIEAGTTQELARVLEGMGRTDLDAVNVLSSPFLTAARGQLIAGLAKARLPAIYQWADTAQEGALLAYGPSLAEAYNRLAVMIDKILRGASPADLPIEQATRIRLVINLNTAKALGLTIPPTLLARADEVIE